jgi:hypothetical protein
MNHSFTNKQYEGPKGKLLLELSKSYKNDSRFKLDNRFAGDV